RPGGGGGGGGDGSAAERALVWRDVAEGHAGRDVAKVEREEGRRERPNDRLAEGQDRRPRSPDVDRHGRIPQRIEEAEPFEVIEVEMRQQEVDPARAAGDERAPELPDSGAGVEYERRLV